MNLLYKRKVNKIYKKLINLSSKGRDNIIEFYKYIDELIQKGDYSVYEEVINLYYNIDITKYQNVKEHRDKVWEKICFDSNLPILVRLSNLYKKRGVFQQSNYIIKEDDYELDENGNVLPIGIIIELEETTNNINYLVKNKMYARLVGEKITSLEVTKIPFNDEDDRIIIKDYDDNLNPDQNLFNQYEAAIDFLLN